MKNNQPLLETIKIFVIKSLWILNNPYIGTFYAIILIVVIELRGGVQFGLKSYAWFQNHKYDFRPKLHYTKFNYHFITSILKSLIFLNLYWSTRLVCKKLNWKRIYTVHVNKTEWQMSLYKNSLECKRNKSKLHSCKCSSMSSKILLLQKINSLLQSLILVVWLNNISPSLLQRLWLRHRVFLGEKTESTASVILTKKNDNLLST